MEAPEGALAVLWVWVENQPGWRITLGPPKDLPPTPLPGVANAQPHK